MSITTNRMWAALAELESIASIEQRVKLLLALPIERDQNISAIVEPFPTLCRELPALHGVFDGFR